MLSLDPLLHRLRLKYSHERVEYLLPRRPAIQTISPPVAGIYLTRTHIAARRLHWSLVSIRLNRCLSRRPKLDSLVSANILPKECCKIDRHSGNFVWGIGVAGPLVQSRRRLERERLKEGLRVRLEKKANAIRERRREGAGVGILIGASVRDSSWAMLLRSMLSLVDRKFPEERRSEASDASGKGSVALAILKADPSGWC